MSESALQACKALHDLAARLLKTGVSVAKLAANFGCGMNTPTAVGAALRHATENEIAADEVRQIVAAFEAQESPETQERRNHQRATALRYRARRDLQYSRDLGPSPEWTRKAVMEFARRRRDVLICAINCVEQDKDGKDGEVITALGKYLTGKTSMDSVEDELKALGFSVDGNVIPFVPLSRRGAS